jgi:hypothetical protein
MQEGMHVVPASAFPSARQMKWIVVAMLVYFGARLFFFAISISPHVPPDEVTHFGKCEIFSNVFLLPANSEASHPFGLVTNIPWFYYWIMGKLLSLNFLGISDLTFLRLLNIPLAFGTVYFVWRMLRLLTDDRLTGILLVAVITNTMMFSFLSASVSYDNLTNLLAATAIYFFLAYFKERSVTMLAASILCQLLGCLTKNTFLPLVLILGIVLFIHEFKKLLSLPSALTTWLHSSGKRGLGLVFAIVLGLILNIQLYGGNYVHYRTLEPETYDVFSLEHALEYRLAARSYIFTAFREGRITMEQANEMAVQINHPGDRADTVNLVKNYEYYQQSGQKPIGRLFYAALWIRNMMESTFGIKAHLGIANHGLSFIPLAVMILLGGIAFLVRLRQSAADWLPQSMAAIAVSYGCFLLFGMNYPAYLEYNDVIMTVAGRYLFPVLGPIYVLFSFYLLRLFSNRKVRLGISCAGVLTFIVCDFPFFLSNVTSGWFTFSLQ